MRRVTARLEGDWMAAANGAVCFVDVWTDPEAFTIWHTQFLLGGDPCGDPT